MQSYSIKIVGLSIYLYYHLQGINMSPFESDFVVHCDHDLKIICLDVRKKLLY